MPLSVRHARPQFRRYRALPIVLAVVGALVLGLGVTGVLVYRHLQGNISSLDVSRQLGDDRPADTGEQGPQNILVMGTDTRAGDNAFVGGDEKDAGRSDTTILLHVAADRRSALGVSIPRDSMVRMPDCTASSGSTTGAALRQFNDAFTIGGPGCTLRTVEQLTGVRVDHYVVVDFTGFRDIVDALGGVEICLARPIRDARSRIDLPAGRTRVDGDEALGYVRVRHGVGDGGDLGRVQRQQAFLAAVLQEATSAGTLANPKKLYDLLNTATKTITVDPELASLTALGGLARELNAIGLKDIRFITVPTEEYAPDRNRLQWAPAADRVWEALRTDRPLVTTPRATATRRPPATASPRATGPAGPSAGPSPSPSAVEVTGVEARSADADICS